MAPLLTLPLLLVTFDQVQGSPDNRLGVDLEVFVEVVHGAGLSEVIDAQARNPDRKNCAEECQGVRMSI
jgi:hypothetical protein